MTNNTMTLPTDADARALMIDLMRAASTYIATSLTRDDFSDDDCDYMPAATSLLAAMTRSFFLTDNDDDLLRDELITLINDDDFIADLDCAFADFDCDLMRLLLDD